MAELAIHCADGLSLEGLIKLAIRNADCEDYLTCDNKNESLESLLKRAFSIGDDGTYALNVCGCSGGVVPVGGLTEVTYSELVALIGSSGLTPGGFYLLTDFATKHYFMDGYGTFNEINTGATEPLILLASSSNNIDTRVYSPSYPQDIIHYDWNPDNWLIDYSFSLDQANIINGWKGVITFRHDIQRDNYTGYDFRNVKFRRWALNPPTWDSGTSYSRKQFVKEGNELYISIVNTNLNHQPSTSGGVYWANLGVLNSLQITKYLAWQSTTCNDIPVDANDYEDFYTFPVYDEYCVCNHISPSRDNANAYWIIATILNNIIIGAVSAANSFGANSFLITIGSFCQHMRFDSDNIEFILTDTCKWSSFETGTNRITAKHMQNSSTKKLVGKLYLGNFTDSNEFGSQCNNIILGDYSTYNNLDAVCTNLYFKTGTKNNRILTSVTNVDFSGATHVYNNYDCIVQNREDGTARLSYINNSDVLTIAAATA